MAANSNFENLRATEAVAHASTMSDVLNDTWGPGAARGRTSAPTAQLEDGACTGTFKSAPPEAAFRLAPAQIDLAGGLVVFDQPCDSKSVQNLIPKGFIPTRS